MLYYSHLLANKLDYSPQTVLLEGIRLEGIPHFGSGGCCKYATLISFDSLFPAFVINLSLGVCYPLYRSFSSSFCCILVQVEDIRIESL